jgi:hypothetical protein
MNDLSKQHSRDLEDIQDVERFDLRQSARALYAGRHTIMVTTAICLLVAIVYLHITKPAYTATIVLSPTQSQTTGVEGNISSLASLAGISIGRGQNASPFLLFPYALNTELVAKDMAQHSSDIMPTIFAAQWDATNNKWQEPATFRHWVSGIAKTVLGFPEKSWAPPDGGELQQYIKKNVSVETSTQKPVLTITFDNENPVFAAHFLQSLYESTDRILRRIVLDRSSKYARYVENKLQTVQLAELRQVLMQSLNDQETLVMMSSSNTPFAAQPLGAASSSIQPTSPNAPIVLLLSIVLGLVLGSAAALTNIDILKYLPSRTKDRSRTSKRANPA